MNMQYIPLFDLCKQLHFELIWKEDLNNIDQIINEINSKNIQFQGFNSNELVLFLQELNGKKILFHSWIEENHALKTILTQHKIEKKLILPQQITQNILWNDFLHFISPILKAPLFSCLQKNQNYEIGFSYLELLSAIDRKDIEVHLFDITIQKKINQISQQKIKSEKELGILLQEILNDQNKFILNHFSTHSNYLKIQFLEHAIQFIRLPQCSKRLGNWFVLELQKLNWDEASQSILQNLKNEIDSGAFSFKNNTGSKRKGKSTILFTLLFISVVSIFAYWLFQQNDEPSYLSDINSSFEDFSPAERKKIDSLIKRIENKTPDALETQLDPNMPMYGLSETLTYKQKTGISDVDSLISDLKKDMNLHLNDAYSSFKKQNSSKVFSYRKMKTLASKQDGKSVLWKNESEYDILLIVYGEKASYTAYLPAKQKGTYMLAQNDHFIVLPGQTLEETPTLPSKNKDNPSSSLKHHFKVIDVNYAQFFMERYQITSQKKAKILLTGELNRRLSMVDLMDISTLEQ